MGSYTVKKLITSVKENNTEKKTSFNLLSLDDIKNNVKSDVFDKRMINALSLANQEIKLKRKAVRIWEGIVKFQPFRDFNDMYALLVTDAFLRMNGFKLTCPEDLKIFADQYCWNVDYVKYRKAIKGNFLEVLFNYRSIEENDVVWGFEDNYPIIVETIKENLIYESLSYERSAEDEYNKEEETENQEGN